ncbi:hypothetical protein AAZV13_06G254100 [Glycine max]
MCFPVYKDHLTFFSFPHSFTNLSYFISIIHHNNKMSSGIRAWSVATSVGVVEALKDQGICRWNHALRSAQHHLKNHVGSFSQANKLSSSAMISTTLKHEKAKQSEESFRTVMYLSCWGPN